MTHSIDHERRREIERDISSYISVRRKKDRKGVKDIVKFFKSKKRKNDADLHPDVESYGGVIPKKSKQEHEIEESEMERDFEEGSTKKTFWSWMKEKVIFEKEPHESLADSGEEMVYEEKTGEEHPPMAEDYEMEDEYVEEAAKDGWFSRLMGKVFVKSREEEEIEDVNDLVAEDMQDIKEIAEISTKVMKLLPADKLKEFKHGPDFEKFKEILRKRELIK